MIMACRLTAQTFTTLHSFNPFDRNDGNYPHGLVLSSNALYGTLEYGGSSPGDGMVFAINTDGTGFTNLHSFTLGDGSEPVSGLCWSGRTCLGSHRPAAVGSMARCSRLTPMAPVLRTCIASR
jgi:uncharacterized repeat protein (TIGR03803 family)